MRNVTIVLQYPLTRYDNSLRLLRVGALAYTTPAVSTNHTFLAALNLS